MTWSQKQQGLYREINVTAEYLNRPAELVITSLLHEMCHLFNIQHNIQDTSRNGTYHNKSFADAALSHGLLIEKDEKYGYCRTLPSDELKQWVNINIRKGCFRYKRAKTYKNGTPKTTTGTGNNGKEATTSRTKQSSRKYTCPNCGLTIRATKDVTGKLLCIECNEILIES